MIDKISYDLYENRSLEEKKKCLLFRSDSIFSDYVKTYPTKLQIITKNLDLTVQQPKNLYSKEFKEKIFSNTFIIIFIDQGFTYLKTNIGTFFNIKCNNESRKVIITNYSIISNYSKEEGTALYAIYPRALTNKKVEDLLSSFYYITQSSYDIDKKKKIFTTLINKHKDSIYQVEPDDNFIQSRKKYMKYIQTTNDSGHLSSAIHKTKFAPLMDVCFLTIEPTISIEPIALDILENIKQKIDESGELITISSIPYIDIYSKLSQHISDDEYYFYNEVKLFSEDILSLNFGRFDKSFLNNNNLIGVAYYYKNISLPGEIIYESKSQMPLGISYVPDNQKENFFSFMGKHSKEFNLFIPFSNCGFISILKVYLGIDREINLRGDKFQTGNGQAVAFTKSLVNEMKTEEQLIPINGGSIYDEIKISMFEEKNKDDENSEINQALQKKKIALNFGGDINYNSEGDFKVCVEAKEHAGFSVKF